MYYYYWYPHIPLCARLAPLGLAVPGTLQHRMGGFSGPRILIGLFNIRDWDLGNFINRELGMNN
jgi:hypothetical protein